MKKNIYITGFMGSGKSRVGRMLAQKLSRPLLDTDKMIEAQSQMSIAEIFKTKGEEHFRQLERETILAIDPNGRHVVSLGGGASIQPQVQEFIKNGLWVYLDTDFEIIKERVMRSTHRPLAQNPNQLKALYDERLPIYKKAPIIIPNQGDSEAICQTLIQRILTDANS